MNRALAASTALLVTGLLITAAGLAVEWLMTSATLLSVVRSPWFAPAAIGFNGTWVAIWLPFYIAYIEKKKKKADAGDGHAAAMSLPVSGRVHRIG